jgi:hypothetical protein
MENKINIAELLKNCPKGMELDCIVYDDCVLEDVLEGDLYPVLIKTPEGTMRLTRYGCFSPSGYSKCVIFPKGKTTWEGFQRPFKDGDIVTWEDRGSLVAFIYKKRKDVAIVEHHFALYAGSLGVSINGEISLIESEIVFATEEEKQKLFDAIKANGYKWNEETKTLEKLFEPKFKVGDIVQDKDNYKVRIFDVSIEDKCYGYESLAVNGIGGISFDRQDDWELVPNKFDINTLKPFESRVLVRNSNDGFWQPTFWGIYEAEKANRHLYRNYLTTKGFFRHCIPYNDDTKHLLGTTDDCDDYYKTWEIKI